MTTTKADVPSPRRAKRSSLEVLTKKPITPADNMKEATLKDLSFKVEPEMHLAFKSEATMRGMKMKDLLTKCFEFYVDNHPR